MRINHSILSLVVGTMAVSTCLAAEKPNVIFILADDLGYGEVGCFGQEKIKTPSLDAMANEGMKITRHYAGAPVCAPSRCVLLTGKHLGHAQIRGNRQAKLSFPEFNEGQHPITKDVTTLAEVFKSAGYNTAAMGKWGLGPVGSTGGPNQQGFDHFFGYNCQAVAHSFYPKFLWNDDKQVLLNKNPVPGHGSQPEGEVTFEKWTGENYSATAILNDALAWLGKQTKETPFFLYLPFTEPHVAIQPPEEHLAQYPEAWDPKPYRGTSAYSPYPRPRAGYATMVSDLDSYVGKVRKILEEKGIAENTLVIFTSDNGTTHQGADPDWHIGGVDAEFFNSTRGLNGYKGSVYEGGLRVPTIVCWPGKVKAGTSSDFPSYFPDWFPTLCEMSGIEAPKGLDGISIAPTLEGKSEDQAERTPMIWIYPEYGGQVSVRIGDYNIMRRELQGKKPLPWEVYDVVNDMGESKNLASLKPELIAKAKEILSKNWDDNEIFRLDREKSLAD